MKQNEDLIIILNQLFDKLEIPSLQFSENDTKYLFEKSLLHIWDRLSNPEKRTTAGNLVKEMFVPYFGETGTHGLYNTTVTKLNNEFPSDENYSELYNFCLRRYNDFIILFDKEKIIDKQIIESIIHKIFILIDHNKNSIIRKITTEDSKYSTHVYHGINTTIISIIGAMELSYSREQLTELGIASLIHDMGMLKIPKSILQKEGKLTVEEFTIVRKHPQLLYEILKKSGDYSEDILLAVLQHHEHISGTGYPEQLTGEQIHSYARIIAISDALEAQISNRSYRSRKTAYSAMKEVISEADKRFEGSILTSFLKSISIYPPGTLVQLSDNSIGFIHETNPDSPLRPQVRIVLDNEGNRAKQLIINLIDEKQLHIVHVLDKEKYKKRKLDE